jgi:copper chaperone CopZ
MKTFLLLVAITIASFAKAQITKVSLQASGLTCSMCSNSITKALKTLDFVEKIDANLKTYTYEITFKKDSRIDFDKIRQKVENAGFSISGFTAFINFNKQQLAGDQSVRIGEQTLLITNAKEQLIDGTRQVTILEKGFIPAKKAKSSPFLNYSPGTYHVAI